jgi:hypothetical protein
MRDQKPRRIRRRPPLGQLPQRRLHPHPHVGRALLEDWRVTGGGRGRSYQGDANLKTSELYF